MRRFFALLAVLCLAFAPVPFRPTKPSSSKEDLQKMQGKWTIAHRTLNGKEAARNSDLTVEIIGDRIWFLVKGKVSTEWTFTVDVTKNPRILDRKKVSGPGPGNAAMPVKAAPVMQGIYRLDGDTLLLSHAYAAGGQQRPTDFEGKKRGENMYRLERVKP